MSHHHRRALRAERFVGKMKTFLFLILSACTTVVAGDFRASCLISQAGLRSVNGAYYWDTPTPGLGIPRWKHATLSYYLQYDIDAQLWIITDRPGEYGRFQKFLYFAELKSNPNDLPPATGWRPAPDLSPEYNAPPVISDMTVPVELVSATARATGPGIIVEWSTATEIECYGFDIERRQIRSDGIWEKVGFVEGAGTSSSPRHYAFLDGAVAPGRHAYRLKQIDRNGTFRYYESIEVEAGTAPRTLVLAQNYPNPFNPATSITFTVPEDGRATLRVFDVLGHEVAVLFDQPAAAGVVHQVTFNASGLSSGTYFSLLEYGNKRLMKRMVLMK